MNMFLKLYKYQPLSEDRHFDYLQNYIDQRVWLTPLGQFNDPFEGKCSFVSFPTEYILNNPYIFENILIHHRLSGEPGLTEAELRSRLISTKLNGKSIQISSFKRHGALCLTRKNTNIPMWAYYGDNHKGYCVEFELDFAYLCKAAQIDSNKIKDFIDGIDKGSIIFPSKLRNHLQAFIFAKVRYREDIPTIIFDDYIKLNTPYDQIECVVKNSVGAKSTEWKHEDEFRLIVNGNSDECGLLPLQVFAPFIKVTGIIIGEQMNETNRKRVQDLCGKKKMGLYGATFSNSHFEIIIKPTDRRGCAPASIFSGDSC